MIAADFNRDGSANALDALSILQLAVGQPTSRQPEWVFIDSDADLSGITRTYVFDDTGANLVAMDGVIASHMTSIRLGNLEAP